MVNITDVPFALGSSREKDQAPAFQKEEAILSILF